MKEQSLNKRNTRKFKYKGETKSLFEWAEGALVSPHTFARRIEKGWSMERALTEPCTTKPVYPLKDK